MTASSDQTRKAEQFRGLHIPGKPFVLCNVWDAGSAETVAGSGAKAIATSSWSVANANGFADGERIPLALAIDNLRRIISVTDLPVTLDLESGYGDVPDAVGQAVGLAIDAGAVGCNLEDSFPANGKLRDIAEQCDRIRRARQVADAAKIQFFLNLRTDVFFQTPPEQHTNAMVAEVIERARAYADAGADGIFAPGLADITLIAQVAKASPLPLNIMVSDATPPLRTLAEHGVARVSHGPGPCLIAMKALEEAARAAHELSICNYNQRSCTHMSKTLRLLVDRLNTPIGEMLIVADQNGNLRAVDWTEYESRMHRLLRLHYGENGFRVEQTHNLHRLTRAISRYFEGELAAIETLPVETGGTAFQRDVWRALRNIPCGTTISYVQLAAQIGRPAAVRAVGSANGSNPIGVVVPCHRVIGADGSLTGYGGGIGRKRWLLEHEGASIAMKLGYERHNLSLFTP